MDASSIPAVDISALAVHKQHWDPAACVSETKQMIEAFKNIGFVYLINHGITQEQIDTVNQHAKRFFDLPRDIKLKYKRGGNNENQGWEQPETETLNPQRPADLKEAYNCTPQSRQVWPDEELPEFKEAVRKMQCLCEMLALRILKLIAIGLGVEPGKFEEAHVPFAKSASTLRCLYYSPLPSDLEVKKNQARCGEHTDYGSITLLFQDHVGGLEVQSRENKWVPATPISGSVLVNIADLMQRWTSDVLVSTPHRVLIPELEVVERPRSGRQSVVFFAHPRGDCIIEPVDRSNKYPSITAAEYLRLRYSATYK